jgi:hypothetical protein
MAATSIPSVSFPSISLRLVVRLTNVFRLHNLITMSPDFLKCAVVLLRVDVEALVEFM